MRLFKNKRLGKLIYLTQAGIAGRIIKIIDSEHVLIQTVNRCFHNADITEYEYFNKKTIKIKKERKHNG